MGDAVREIKLKLDIAEVVGDYVELRRKGNTLWGRCPFHQEKTPSFSVSQSRQTFHCFGCNKGGDVFTFVMEIEGLEFREALENLAARAGVTVTREKPANRPPKLDATKMLEEALTFYRKRLDSPGGEAPRAYLQRRNISKGDAARFELGWSPASWNALLNELEGIGFNRRDIVNAGLAIEGERGAYDRFRGRVMFPVRNDMGKLVGFGGRLVDGEGAKYVNSPEGEVFNKRKILYLMHEAKKAIRERGRVILMEGYMDAMRAHLAGFAESVASLGTALTEEQAAMIKRFSDLCYICYDADAAGQEAALRGMYILQSRGVDVRVMSLEGGKDPDDILSAEGGVALFESRIAKALPLPLYHVQVRRADLRTPGVQIRAREDLLNGLASLSDIALTPYMAKIARTFGVMEHVLWKDIAAHRSKAANRRDIREAEGISPEHRVYINDDGDERAEEADEIECAICSALWALPDARASVFRSPELISCFSDEAIVGIVTALASGEQPEELERRWQEIGDRLCPSRIALGNAILEREGLDVASLATEEGGGKMEKLLDALRRKSTTRRYDALKTRRLREQLTQEEEEEYQRLAKALKVAKK